MLQRLIAAVLGVLGLASIGLGVASATAWRADDVLVATAPTASTSAGTLVVTAPGVLEMGGSEVTVSAEAAGGTKVVLAIGKEADVAGWVGSDSHSVISGLVDRQTLRVEQAETEPAPDPAPEVTEAPAEDGAAADPAAAPPVEAAEAPDPDGSDLWVQQAAGERSAELTWTPQPGRWTLLAAGVGEGAAAPSVVLSWPQTVTTPWLVPGVVVGGILLLIALALGARLWTRARRGEQADWHAVETGAIPIVVRAGLPPAAGSGASGRGASTIGASPTGTIPNGSGAVDAGESTLADRSAADITAADDAPTLILTRRQMREAAAPAPRGSMRRRGPHTPGDAAPTPNRGVPAIPQATAPVTGIPQATAPATGIPQATAPAESPTAPISTPGTAGRPVPATRRTTRGSGGSTSSAAPGAASPEAASDRSESSESASSESVSSQARPHRSESPATPAAAAETPPPRTGRRWFARRPTSVPDPAPETAPAGGSGAGARSSSPLAGPAAAAGTRPVTGSASAADARSDDARLSGSDGARTQWTPTRPAAPAAGAAASTPPTGSRADAWRRSWGIPEVDATDQTGSTESTSPASASSPTSDSKGKPDESGRPDTAPRSGKDA